MDRDVNRLTAVTSAIMIAVLLVVAFVSVEPYYLIRQEHVLYAESRAITAFDHPALLPTISEYRGPETTRITADEWLRVSPHNSTDSTAGWSYNGTGEQARYVCNLSWNTGYSVYVAGTSIFDGNVPWAAGNLTLIDTTGQADGQRNALHMPEFIRPGTAINTVTG